MTPRQAAPGSTITVRGTLKNASQQQMSHLAVRLLSSSTPLSNVAQLQASASEPDMLADTPVPGASRLTRGQLKPGATVGWSIRVKAKAIGMRAFGVYPLAAQAQSTLADVPPATAATYLPYVPAKKGPDGSSIPARTKISWVWPLIDKPLLLQPGQNACQGAQAQALAASLGSGGRLGQLVGAGAIGARTAITWAIDPALLANAEALTACGSSQPKWAAAARSWLARLRQVSSAQPVFLTPYGDTNVAAMITAGHADDVHLSFQAGGLIASQAQTLNRAISPATAARTPAAQGQTASIAWPAGGIPGGNAGYSALETLAANDGIRALLLGSSYLPAEHATVLRTPNSLGGYMKIVLANESITGLLGTGGTTSDSAFATAQEFLAETALLATQGEPIVVAPPQRWAPAPGLAAELLAVTSSASWLSPVSLTSLTSLKNIQVLPQLPGGPRPRMLNRTEVRVLSRVDSKIAQLEVLQAGSHSANFLTVAAAGHRPGMASRRPPRWRRSARWSSASASS